MGRVNTSDGAEGLYSSPCPCNLCGEPARAYWSGPSGEIWICGSCALEVLPRLIADATVGEHVPHYGGTDQAFRRIQVAYWEAAAKRHEAFRGSTARQHRERVSDAHALLAAYPEGITLRMVQGKVVTRPMTEKERLVAAEAEAHRRIKKFDELAASGHCPNGYKMPAGPCPAEHQATCECASGCPHAKPEAQGVVKTGKTNGTPRA